MTTIERLDSLADEWRAQADRHRDDVAGYLASAADGCARALSALLDRHHGDAETAILAIEDAAAEARAAMEAMLAALMEAAEADGAAATLEETADLAAYHAKVL